MSSMSAEELTTRRLWKSARRLALAIPTMDTTDVLFAVGITPFDSPELKMKLRDYVKAYTQQNGMLILGADDDAMVKRAALVYTLMKRNPDKPNSSGKIKLTDAMVFAGWGKSVARSGTSEYMRVFRLIQNHKKRQDEINRVELVADPRPIQHRQNRRPPNVSVPVATNRPANLSPLTVDHSNFNGNGGVTPTSTDSSDERQAVLPDDFESNYYVWPLTYPTNDEDDTTETKSVTSLDVTLSSLPSRIKPVSLQSLTTTTTVRNTSNSAHQERQLISEGQSIRSSVFKAATVLWDGVTRNENTLKVFNSAEKVADAFNRFSGIELISGHELEFAVRQNQVGQSPPRRGRLSTVPDDEFKAFCDAVFTYSAIQQINSVTRSNRSELASLVGEILNTKRSADDDGPLGEAHFFRRIELENSRRQTLSNPDKRESIRVQWLTHMSQKLNYERWEECAVELGFARLPLQDEETNGQHIIWYEGQEFRVVNLDEMSLSLDASSTRGGGRQSQLPVAMNVHGDGQAAPKSSDKVTVIYGMNYGNEAMPPYIQFPTKSKDVTRYKLQTKLLLSLRQVKGKFGYPADRYFDTGIGMNQKGGMNREAFKKYITEFLFRLYPDAVDVPRRRVLIKINSGPGRFNAELQRALRIRGFYMFTGVPNGTEVGQEMDQLYSYAKTLCYRNRDKLYKARGAIDCEGTSLLNLADVGYLIFGGKVALSDGSEIELEPAFDMAFDEPHLQRAKEKCGYLPSTRAALTNPKVRHEFTGEIDGGSNEDEQGSIAALYESIEEQNSTACELLLDRGYSLAAKLKLKLRKIESNRAEARDRVLTEPNTRARQDLMMKVSTAGQYFRVTNGGGPMGSNDALIAWARKDMLAKANEMKKQRAILSQFGLLTARVSALFQKKPADLWLRKWLVQDLKDVISWKQGPYPVEQYNHKPSTMSKGALQTLYRDSYQMLPDPLPEDSSWTDVMEERLCKLERGEIEDFFDDVGLTRSLERDEEELVLRLQDVQSDRRKSSIIKSVFKTLQKQARQDLAIQVALMIDDPDPTGTEQQAVLGNTTAEEDSENNLNGSLEDDADSCDSF